MNSIVVTRADCAAACCASAVIRLLAQLEALPEARREAFALQYEAGMTVEEIASATGVSRETAKSRLRYALGKLRLGVGEWR